jgi:RNA polymerase sigma-70 factor (ECF subfamily)
MEFPGNRRNIQRLVDEHYVALYRYAYRLTSNSLDAEDLTQEVFCAAQMKLGQLRDPARAKSWLFTILRNAYLHRVRSQKQAKMVSLDDLGEFPEPPPEPLPPIEPQRLQQALKDLPEDFRTPVILFYFEDFSYRDIAEQMDLPLGTVMSRLARAKAHLRSRLLMPAVLVDGQRRAIDGM